MTQGNVFVGPISFNEQSFPSPIARPDLWDTLRVQGVTWTGKFEFRGACIDQKWDPKHARGQVGTVDSYVGNKPEPFDLVMYLWTDLHFAQWPSFQSLFVYQGSKGTARPTSIEHPALAVVGISAVTCLKIGIIQKVDDELLYSCTIKLRQFQPPANVSGGAITPSSASHVSPPNVPGRPPRSAALQAALDERAGLDHQVDTLVATLPK